MNPVALKATLTLFGPLLAVGVMGLIGCAVHAWWTKRR